ncbi:MAG: DNA polymerase [Syntrophobacteraceae bacterium]
MPNGKKESHQKICIILALSHISGKLNCLDARIVNTLHDEIIVEARDGIEDQVEAIVKESMEEALRRIIPEVPFVAETKIADSWKS